MVSELADAAGAQLSVASSRCVLLSPSGECVAPSLTAPATNLSDGDVVIVLVMDLPRVYAHPKGWAFAAVTNSGSVVTWGDAGRGGNPNDVKSELSGGVLRPSGVLLVLFFSFSAWWSSIAWSRASSTTLSCAHQARTDSSLVDLVHPDTA